MKARSHLFFVLFIACTSCLATSGDGGCGRPISGDKCICDDSLLENHNAIEANLTPSRGGILQIRLPSEPGMLLSIIDDDPIIRSVIDHDVLEALVQISEDGQTIKPELAQSWEADEYETQYIFHLARDARWHDGHPVTAADVVFTIERLLDPAEKIASRSRFDVILEATPIDDHTVALTLDSSITNFLHTLSEIPILPAHIFGHVPLSEHPASRAPIGSGPFRFSRWIHEKLIEIERNPDWRGSPVHIDKIVYRIARDSRVALDLFRQGELDIVMGLSAVPETTKELGIISTYPLPRFEAWVYNTGRSVFARRATRLAVGMTIDRAVIRCSILNCRAQLIEGPWPPNHPLAPAGPSALEFNPTQAREILKQDGWEDRDGDGIREREGVKFSFTVLLPDMGRDLQRMAAVVQDDLSQIGVEMRATTVTWSTYTNLLRSHRFDASIVAHNNKSTFDPWQLFHSQAINVGKNWGAFVDPQTDEIIDGLRVERGDDKKRSLMEQLMIRLRTMQPVTFTYRPFETILVRKGFHAVSIRDGWIDEQRVWKEGSSR